mgnify:FL=1
MPDLVIVGAGLGGLAAAWDAARFLPDYKIKVIGDERPYVRHKLRVAVVGKDISISTKHIENLGVEFVWDKVAKIKREQREVVLESGQTLNYDYLILATGSQPSRPKSIEGIEKAMGFRRLEDARRLREEKPGRVAIIGASFVALHVADSALAVGAEPVLIVRSRLVRKSLEPELSQKLEERLKELGVKFVHAKPKSVKDNAVEADGETVEADLVVTATGVDPDIRLAKEAGLELIWDWAVKVDEQGRTSDPRIFAIGDVANCYCPVTGKPDYFGIGTVATLMAYNAVKAIQGSKAVVKTPAYIKDAFMGRNFVFRAGLVSPQAEKAGFNVERIDVSGTEYGDHAYLVYEKETRRLIGFSSVSSRDIGSKAIELEKAIRLKRKVDDVLPPDVGR